MTKIQGIKEQPHTKNGCYPHRLFRVPEGVKLLDEQQLAMLEESFRIWKAEAMGTQSEASRTRIWLLFQLLRHTAARLGEVQSIALHRDIDTSSMVVRLTHHGREREVPLPRKLCREIACFCDSPLSSTLGEQPFAVDQGYVRRLFYARADVCSIPRELATPRVLRTTRAVELLRSGVPLAVVTEVLGQASAALTAVLQSYSSGDRNIIIRRLVMDAAENSSARNSFRGTIQHITTDAIMAEVRFCTASGRHLAAVITVESLRSLGLELGCRVEATVKAPYVHVRLCPERIDMASQKALRVVSGIATVSDVPLCAVTPELDASSTAANSFYAYIVHVRSSGVMAEILGQAEDGTLLCALVADSDRKAAGISLENKSLAEFSFKPLSVVLHRV